MAPLEQRNTPGMVARSKEKAYKFKKVYSEQSTSQIFDEFIKDEVNNALEGSNSCVFAFGATGSGKTFTMFGGTRGDSNQQGVVECAIRVVLFKEVFIRQN